MKYKKTTVKKMKELEINYRKKQVEDKIELYRAHQFEGVVSSPWLTGECQPWYGPWMTLPAMPQSLLVGGPPVSRAPQTLLREGPRIGASRARSAWRKEMIWHTPGRAFSCARVLSGRTWANLPRWPCPKRRVSSLSSLRRR